MNTYLGKKGYTIYKRDLSLEQIQKIKEDLTIKPHVHGSPVQDNQTVYFVYRESNNKIYVPQHYGIKEFGPPSNVEISEGENIDIEFNGQLRDYQIPVVEKYIKETTQNGYSVNDFNYGGGLLELPCAWGKTSASLYILSKIKKKTIVIVHKEFLMNQWIERIQQFLPTARIGKIQGQVIDIENKDIVLCMLQSLSMKEYPPTMFDIFGFMIIDEVHHISSEVFSNSLFKIVTRYMLGLSATMNRKDGTTYVFKMFLGDVIFKGKRTEKLNVQVRAIDYKVNDDEFNHVITDYRGNTSYSSMITKLCEYNHRSEFILRILIDLLKENENQQIMILAHNKNLLKYLFDAVKHRTIANGSVGYYIGGMKELALKESETKKIVIATYAMASEGLDIKTLTTLIMATPKTDIEQSVGRILREKNENGPLVVDIIDSHDPFKNQWKKRKAFYMKEKYKIIHTTSDIYNTINTLDNTCAEIWQTVYDPDNVCSSKTTKTSYTTSTASTASTTPSAILSRLMKPKNSKYKKNVFNNVNTETNYNFNDIDSDPFLQGNCFIKL
jgi:superfamily II DNA or RNA helicase